jgi:hypothetical protein
MPPSTLMAWMPIRERPKQGLGRNELAVGDVVGFVDREQRQRPGKIVRLNDKTVTLNCGNQQWRIVYGAMQWRKKTECGFGLGREFALKEGKKTAEKPNAQDGAEGTPTASLLGGQVEQMVRAVTYAFVFLYITAKLALGGTSHSWSCCIHFQVLGRSAVLRYHQLIPDNVRQASINRNKAYLAQAIATEAETRSADRASSTKYWRSAEYCCGGLPAHWGTHSMRKSCRRPR